MKYQDPFNPQGKVVYSPILKNRLDELIQKENDALQKGKKTDAKCFRLCINQLLSDYIFGLEK